MILPHDAMQERGRSAEAPSSHNEGYYLGGTYIYEKKCKLPESETKQSYYLEFEGVYPNAVVEINGKQTGHCLYGYSSMKVPIEDVNQGEEAAIKVLIDDEEHPKSRWYGGAGIYRPVWLVSLPEEHIIPDKR